MFAQQNFGDLVFAQQYLSTNVQAYLDILQSLWTSVVGVADFLQTDDLYQMAKPHALPELPDFKQLPQQWACGHDTLAASCASGAGVSGPRAATPAASMPPSLLPGGASLLPSPVVKPPATPRLAKPTDRPRVPPSVSESDATAWLERWHARLIDPAALSKSYFGEEENHEGQDF